MILRGLTLVSLMVATLASTASFAAPAPWQYHRILGYDAAAELQSQSETHRIVAELVEKYNARFTGGVDDIADKSDASAIAFTQFQQSRIDQLKANGRIEPLFKANMKAASEEFDFFAVTDEQSDLVAIMFTRQKARKTLSESILLIRPIQALTNGQTIQDAFDITAFYLEAPKPIDSRSGGILNLNYATNVSFFGSRPKLAGRTFQQQSFELAKADGHWIARNANGVLASFDVAGGKTGGVSVTAIDK